jgi:6-phosphogluconate dehydrogenase
MMEKSGFGLNLEKIAGLYSHRSVVESRLVEWLKEGFEEFGQEMEGISGSVGASGEGEWTVEAARDLGVPAKVIEDAFAFRVASQDNPSYTGKLLQAMRNRFGGHSA